MDEKEIQALIAELRSEGKDDNYISEVIRSLKGGVSVPQPNADDPDLISVEQELEAAGKDEQYIDDFKTEYKKKIPAQKQDYLGRRVRGVVDVTEEEDFWDYIPEELQDEARAAYGVNGHRGVIDFLNKKRDEDEAYEETLKDIPVPILGAFGFDKEDVKNLGDAWDNFTLQVKQAYPNVKLAGSRIFQGLFGEQTIDRWSKESLESIQVLQAQHKDTARIVKSAQEGDFAETLTGILGAPLSLASTVINTVKTGGVGLFTDMFAETYMSVNELRAQEKGVTLEELIANGDDSVAGPVAFTSMMVALEGLGLGAVGKYLVKSTPGAVKKKLVEFLLANSTEGGTEILQTGLGAAAEEWERSGDVGKAANALLDGVFSEEGAESFALGFFGAGVATAPKLAFNVVKDKRENREAIESITSQISELKETLRGNPKISKEDSDRVTSAIEELKRQGNELTKQPYRELKNASNEDLIQIEESNERISKLRKDKDNIEANPNYSQEEKNTLIGVIDTQISQEANRIGSIIDNANEAKKESDKNRIDQAKERAKAKDENVDLAAVAQREKEAIEREDKEAAENPIEYLKQKLDHETRAEEASAKIEADDTLTEQEKIDRLKAIEAKRRDFRFKKPEAPKKRTIRQAVKQKIQRTKKQKLKEKKQEKDVRENEKALEELKSRKEKITNVKDTIKGEGGINKLISNGKKLLPILPDSAKTENAFGGLFALGAPTADALGEYFDPATKEGKKRIKNLKDTINEVIAEEGDIDQQISNLEQAIAEADIETIFDDLLDISQIYETETEAEAAEVVDELDVDELSDLQEAFDEGFDVYQKLPANSAFVKKLLAPIRKYFGDTVDIVLVPGEKLKAWGKYGLVNGKPTIRIAVGNPNKGIKGIKLDTLYHEPGHVLYQLMKYSNDNTLTKLYNRINKLITETAEYKEISKNEAYADLSKNGLLQEAFAKYFGKYSAAKIKTPNALQKAINDLINYVKKKFGVELNPSKMSLEDISDVLLADLLSGKPTLFEITDETVKNALEMSTDRSFKDAFDVDRYKELKSQKEFWNNARAVVKERLLNKIKKDKFPGINSEAIDPGRVKKHRKKGALTPNQAKFYLNTIAKEDAGEALTSKEKSYRKELNYKIFDTEGLITLEPNWFKTEKNLNLIEAEIEKAKGKVAYRMGETRGETLTERAKIQREIDNLKNKKQNASNLKKIENLENQLKVLDIKELKPDLPKKGEVSKKEYDKVVADRAFIDIAASTLEGILNATSGIAGEVSKVLRNQDPLQLVQTTLRRVWAKPSALVSDAGIQLGKEIAAEVDGYTGNDLTLFQYLIGDFLLNQVIKTNQFLELDKAGDKGDALRIKIGKKQSWNIIKNSGFLTAPVKAQYKYVVGPGVDNVSIGFIGPLGNELIHKVDPADRHLFSPGAIPKVYEQKKKADSVLHETNEDVWNDYEVLIEEGNTTLDFEEKNYTEDVRTNKENEIALIRDDVNRARESGGVYKYTYYFHSHGRMSPEVDGQNFQKTKVARSIDGFAQKDPINQSGYNRMLMDLAALLGSKKTFAEKLKQVQEGFTVKGVKIDIPTLLKWGANPLSHYKEFTKLTKEPHLLWAGLKELHKATNPDGTPNLDYESGLSIFYDAKNSGVQHYVGFTKSSRMAKLVDLVKLIAGEGGRDAYIAITNKFEKLLREPQQEGDQQIFEEVNKDVARIADEVINGDNLKGYKNLQEALVDVGDNLTAKQRHLIDEGLSKYKEKYPDKVRTAAKVFTQQKSIFDNLRTIAKKATVPKLYGAGEITMGQAIYNNYKNDIGAWAEFNPLYAEWQAEHIDSGFNETFPEIIEVKQYLQAFASWMADNNKLIKLTGKVNGFVKIFNPKYLDVRRPTTKYDGHNTFRVKKDKDGNKRTSVTVGNTENIDYPDITKSIAAVVVQFMDAQHVAWMYENTNYPFKQVYDAFSTTPAHAEQMHKDIQRGFKELYEDFDIFDIVKQNLTDSEFKDFTEFYEGEQKRRILKKILKPFPKAKFKKEWGTKLGTGEMTIDDIIDEAAKAYPDVDINAEAIAKQATLELGDWTSDQTTENELSFADAFSEDPREQREQKPKKEYPKEKSNRKQLQKNLLDLVNLRTANYKDNSKYKKSKIDHSARVKLNALKQEIGKAKNITWDQVLDYLDRAEAIYSEGRETALETRARIEADRTQAKQDAADTVEETTGIDIDNTSTAGLKTYRQENRKLGWQLRRFGPLGVIANLLAPSSIANIYYNIARILPKEGKAREAVLAKLNKWLIEPLKNAEYFDSVYRGNLLDGYNGLLDKYKVTKKTLGKKTGIVIDGQEINNGQAIYIYNYIGDRRNHDQLIAAGVTLEKMAEINAYVKANDSIRGVAEEFPSLFEAFDPIINKKLNEHGHAGFVKHVIPTKEDALLNRGDKTVEQVEAEYKILEERYDGAIPETAPYIPFLGKGQKDQLKLDEKVFGEKDGEFYTVMHASLTDRTFGGELDFIGKDLSHIIDRFADGPLRTTAYLDFAKGATSFFTTKALDGFEADLGKKWRDNITENLKRTITGRIDSKKQSQEVQTIHRWMTRAISSIMFFNVRSALTQLVSIPNFALDNPIAYVKYLGATSKNRKSLKMIRESGFMGVRGQGKTDVIFDQLFRSDDPNALGKAIDKLGQDGYFLTKSADKFAISVGGAPYLSWRIDHHREQNPTWSDEQVNEAAMKDFVSKANEAQQSTQQSRLGRHQAEGLGRYMLAFMNATIQFNVKMASSLKEIQAGKNVGTNIFNISSIMGLQIFGFSFLQKMMANALTDDEEDEEKREQYYVGIVQTVLKSRGIWGASQAALVGIIAKKDRLLNKKGELVHNAYDIILNEGVNAFPAVSAKARLIRQSLREPYRQSDGFVEVGEFTTRIAAAIEVTGIPTARVLKIFESFNDLGADDLEVLEKLARVAGYSRYDLQVQLGKFK